ncbi:MAG: CHAP domain-containing protein [Alphaproteobacteria bacterium]|nr:CHAP domain-containing protein [Alphaproteobacteria bacterium]
MTRLLPLLLLGCGPHVPRFPGPLGPVAYARPPAVHVHDLPAADDVPEPPEAPGTAEGRDVEPPRDRPSRRGGMGDAIADSARHYLTHTPPSTFRNDCSGFVMASYARAGLPISGSSRSLWEDAKERGAIHKKLRPEPGDLAFFDDTYDRNGNGRRDDPLTHVAVVLEVHEDGTIVLGHGGTSKGRTELRMNLIHPSQRTGDDGEVMNDWLRARRRDEPEDGKYLAGELWRGFARFEPNGS